MPVSNLQIYNAVIAYNRQKKLSCSLRRKESIASPLNIDKESTIEEKNTPTIDVGEKDGN